MHEESSDDANRPKRCQMRCLGHKYVILNFCSCFYILMIISVIFRSYLTNKCTRSPAMMQMGPNDVRRIVWATGTSFLISVYVFYILMIISIIFRLYLSDKRTRNPAMTRMGPNHNHSTRRWRVSNRDLRRICVSSPW